MKPGEACATLPAGTPCPSGPTPHWESGALLALAVISVVLIAIPARRR